MASGFMWSGRSADARGGARTLARLLLTVALGASIAAQAAPPPVHGLWVWKSAAVLTAPRAPQALVEFCRTSGINEVYLSVPASRTAADDGHFVETLRLLHAAAVRVEALLSSIDADEAGHGRETLLRHIDSLLDFNRQHPATRFDGLHLDIEPQQRPENKGPGNLQFLPGLVEVFRQVRERTDANGLTLNADIPMKLLKGDLGQRRALFGALPRVTLMLYELTSPSAATSAADKRSQLQASADRFFDMAYQGLSASAAARMAIALRTPDYGSLLPEMLTALDAGERHNPHYLGWARHSYNDTLAP
jgi:hypothetical protein